MFAVPIPEEHHAVGETLEQYVTQAIQESEENGMAKAGNDVTPWLLNRVRELSGGVSMASNIALLTNNALVGEYFVNDLPASSMLTESAGGQLAVEYSRLNETSVCN